MKLASLKGGRDGQLAVVSRDLTRAVHAGAVAPTLQAALDNWEAISPKLAELAAGLEMGMIAGSRFQESDCESPLPRAYQWVDGSSYVNHVALVRKARGQEVPISFWTDPLMYQGNSDAFPGPRDPIPLPGDENLDLDLEAEIAVIVDDVPMGSNSKLACGRIRLAMLANDITFRALVVSDLSKGFGFFQSKPPTAFSPVAVTLDELKPHWHGGKVHLPLLSFVNGAPLGRPNAGLDMTFDFGDLIAHAARKRRLTAGTIIGSGTVSNHGPDGGPGKPISGGGAGYSCLAELRAVETLQYGAPRTPFLKPGDHVRIEMSGPEGASIFGAIDQKVLPA